MLFGSRFTIHYRLILKSIFRLNTLAVTWQCLCLVWRRLWPRRSPWLFRKAKTSSCPTPSSKPNGSGSTACYQKTSKTLSPTIVIIYFTHPWNVFIMCAGLTQRRVVFANIFQLNSIIYCLIYTMFLVSLPLRDAL